METGFGYTSKQSPFPFEYKHRAGGQQNVTLHMVASYFSLQAYFAYNLQSSQKQAL